MDADGANVLRLGQIKGEDSVSNLKTVHFYSLRRSSK